MTDIENLLVEGGLHQETTQRMLNHHLSMVNHLKMRNYVEVSSHVGAFCESASNVLLDYFGEEVRPRVQVGTFVDQAISGSIGEDFPRELRLTLPRLIRAAYELRSSRDGVHPNLEVPQSHADAETSVRICSWILSELVRIAGTDENIDEISQAIERLARPVSSIVDVHDGQQLVMSTELHEREEILVHLNHAGDGKASVSDLVQWIPGTSKSAIFAHLRHLSEDRLIRYDSDQKEAMITPLGRDEAIGLVRSELHPR